MEGRTLSHYHVRERLGGGGMGVVYKAEDTRLKRAVALKFLPPELTRDDEARQRFVLEAQAASALDHPNICTIYEIDSDRDERLFIAMAFCDGETLKARLRRGALSAPDALDVALQIARGLEKAHQAGVIHRDIKPANVMVTSGGLVKIVDFGIAKLLDHTGPTRTGTTLGTVAYMAPEQLAGSETDHRVDLWALGVVLYEMLTGRPPFGGDTGIAVATNILNHEPAPIGTMAPDASRELEEVVERALSKRPENRYQSATQFASALAACRARLTTPVGANGRASVRRFTPRQIVAAALVAAAFVGIPAAWLLNRNATMRRVEDGIADVTRLADTDDYVGALARAEQVEQISPNEPRLANLWPRISIVRPIVSDPPGARVSIRSYDDANGEWRQLGEAPIANARLPRGVFRWQAQKDGFDTLEFLAVNQSIPAGGQPLRLTARGAVPKDMVLVRASTLSLTLTGYDFFKALPAGDFLIDKYEVTNKQFKEFVDNGGYANRQYWKQRFVKDSREVSWDQAVAEFRDRTGRPGPATWEVGAYPPGQDTHPVGGVSWYEAAAYAEFAGKALPTIYHWVRAASIPLAAYILPLSNVEGSGPAQVGSHAAISGVGAFDVAGNVKEWCWNETTPGATRYILGGSWRDPAHMFINPDARSPFDRSDTNGFRLAKLADENRSLETLDGPIPPPSRDYGKEKPASDEVFRVYRDLFAYDPQPLEANVEAVDHAAERWLKEKISFRAAYGDEKVPAYLFLPRNARPPYQTVVYFPGAGALQNPSSSVLPTAAFDFFLLSGRAVLFPIYKGTYERRAAGQGSGWPETTRAFRDWAIQWVNDVRRGIDYLETRQDIQSRALAYYGFSWGADVGTRVLALEPRFKVGVLLSGGFTTARMPPEVDPFHFAPHVALPVLMINGESDHIFDVEASQKPYMALLGTPPEHKRHSIYPGGHDMMAQRRSQVVKEMLDWLDRYLGPVER